MSSPISMPSVYRQDPRKRLQNTFTQPPDLSGQVGPQMSMPSEFNQLHQMQLQGDMPNTDMAKSSPQMPSPIAPQMSAPFNMQAPGNPLGGGFKVPQAIPSKSNFLQANQPAPPSPSNISPAINPPSPMVNPTGRFPNQPNASKRVNPMARPRRPTNFTGAVRY